MHSNHVEAPMLGQAKRSRGGYEAWDDDESNRSDWMRTEKKINRAKERTSWKRQAMKDASDLVS